MLRSALGPSLWKISVNHFFLIAAVSLVRSVLSQAPCYSPNGTLQPDDVPCYPSAKVSVCCSRGWTCLSNAVCLLIQDSDWPHLNVGSTYRGSCTDASWNSTECPNFCTGVYQFDFQKHWSSTFWDITFHPGDFNQLWWAFIADQYYIKRSFF